MLHVHAQRPATTAGATTEATERRKRTARTSEAAAAVDFKAATVTAGFNRVKARENLLRTAPASYRKTALGIRQKRRSNQTARRPAVGTKRPG